MFPKKMIVVGAVLISSLGLGACADQYAYGRAPGYDDGYGYSQWDQYYGNPLGWQQVPVGFLGNGFGWYGNNFYPGNGIYVYDRRGVRRAWNQQQRGFWQPRTEARGLYRGRAGVLTGQARPGLVRPGQVRQGQVRPGQVVRQQDRVINRQGRVIDRQRQAVRQQDRVISRQDQAIDRQRQVIRQQRRNENQAGVRTPQQQERRAARQERRQQSGVQGGQRQGNGYSAGRSGAGRSGAGRSGGGERGDGRGGGRRGGGQPLN